MNEIKIIVSRIEHIRNLMDLNINEFSSLLGIDRANYYRYLEGSAIQASHFSEMINLGINVNYVLNGIGKPFLNNNSIEYDDQSNNFEIAKTIDDINESVVGRMIKWIECEYGSFKDFCLINNYNEKQFKYYYYDKGIIDLELIKLLYKLGLNIKYLYSKSSEKYNKSKVGNEKKIASNKKIKQRIDNLKGESNEDININSNDL